MFLKGFAFFLWGLAVDLQGFIGCIFSKNKTLISKVVVRPMVFPLFLPIAVTDERAQHVFPKKQLSCNVPGRSVTTLLPGGSCWGLVTVEEIVGGYLNTFSCWENVFRGRQ